MSVNSLQLSSSYQLNEWDEDIPPSQWQWWYCSLEDKLYKRYTDTLSYIYTTTHTRSRFTNRVYIRQTVTYRDISTLVPCITTPHTVIHNAYNITGECELGPIQSLPVTTFEDYLHKQCEREKWIYQNTSFGDHLQAIVVSLQKCDLRAVCDGSFNDTYGSAAWCIDGDGAIIGGVTIVPVGSDTLDSTRCELAGTG